MIKGQQTELPARIAVQPGTMTYFTAVFEMGTGGTRSLWPSSEMCRDPPLFKAFAICPRIKSYQNLYKETPSHLLECHNQAEEAGH